jgi:hypothetical protein
MSRVCHGRRDELRGQRTFGWDGKDAINVDLEDYH